MTPVSRETPRWYRLEGRTPVPLPPGEIPAGIGTEEWCVERTSVGNRDVSTVFLGFDQNYQSPAGPPLLFETAIFIRAGDGETDVVGRYATWVAAEEGHQDWVQRSIEVTEPAESVETAKAPASRPIDGPTSGRGLVLETEEEVKA